MENSSHKKRKEKNLCLIYCTVSYLIHQLLIVQIIFLHSRKTVFSGCDCGVVINTFYVYISIVYCLTIIVQGTRFAQIPQALEYRYNTLHFISSNKYK
jgi:hypothetical protein